VIRMGDVELEILKTNFFVYIYLGEHGLECSADLEFWSVPKEINGDSSNFHISSHSLAISLPSLELLPGKVFDIGQLVDGEPQMGIYRYEHDPIRDAKLTFSYWTERGINVSFKGVVDICEEPPLAGNLNLVIDYVLPFNAVVVDEPDTAKAVEKLQKYFKLSQFHPPEIDDVGRQMFSLNGIPY